MKDAQHARVLELHQPGHLPAQNVTDDLPALGLVQLVGELLLKDEHRGCLHDIANISVACTIFMDINVACTI